MVIARDEMIVGFAEYRRRSSDGSKTRKSGRCRKSEHRASSRKTNMIVEFAECKERPSGDSRKKAVRESEHRASGKVATASDDRRRSAAIDVRKGGGRRIAGPPLLPRGGISRKGQSSAPPTPPKNERPSPYYGQKPRSEKDARSKKSSSRRRSSNVDVIVDFPDGKSHTFSRRDYYKNSLNLSERFKNSVTRTVPPVKPCRSKFEKDGARRKKSQESLHDSIREFENSMDFGSSIVWGDEDSDSYDSYGYGKYMESEPSCLKRSERTADSFHSFSQSLSSIVDTMSTTISVRKLDP